MFRSTRWVWPVLVGLILGLIIMVYTTSGERTQITVVERWLRDAVSPLQKGITSVIDQVTETWNLFVNLGQIQRENQLLKEKLARLAAENALLQESARENKRWAALFAFQQDSEYNLLAARVIGRAIPDWFNLITIDKGELAGVRPGLPVITTAGVVGQVRQVTANTATVLLAIDSRSAIGGITADNRDYVLVEGAQDQSRLLKVRPLADDARLEVGGQVLTSGLGDIYPKGLTVGEIVEVQEDQYGLTVTGLLKPATDFARLEEVFVILPN